MEQKGSFLLPFASLKSAASLAKKPDSKTDIPIISEKSSSGTIKGVLEPQPAKVVGRNATKILAAHMLGNYF